MRNLFLVLLSAVFLFVGCSEDCPTQPTYEVKLNSTSIAFELDKIDSSEPNVYYFNYILNTNQQKLINFSKLAYIGLNNSSALISYIYVEPVATKSFYSELEKGSIETYINVIENNAFYKVRVIFDVSEEEFFNANGNSRLNRAKSLITGLDKLILYYN